MRTRGSYRRVFSGGVAALLLVSCELLLGHGEGPPPPPEPPPPSAPPASQPLHRVYPARWSWLHWWEANRDSYLQSMSQGLGQKTSPEVIAEYRRRATDGLLEAIGNKDWQVRAAACLSLGQMGHKDAFDKLAQLARSDVDERVRTNALIAIGLLDGPEQEKFLIGLNYPDQKLADAGLCAQGLMSKLSDQAVTGMRQKVEGPDPGAATLAAWALRLRADAADRKSVETALTKSTSPWLASEAILALGADGGTEAVSKLSEILLATPRAQQSVAASKALNDRREQLLRIANAARASRQLYDAEYAKYAQDHAAWQKNNPNGPAAKPPSDSKIPALTLEVGNEEIYEARLRASAAIALGFIDCPESRQALVKCLEGDDDGYNELYKGQAIMSLGRLADQAGTGPMGELLNPMGRGGAKKSQEKLKSPLRGFAALALGMYCRPIHTPQGDTDPPNFDRIAMALAERMSDVDEQNEVRTACAMGLGLSGRTENLKYLQPASKSVEAGNDILTGYTILARGMLGDRSGILEPAGKFLNKANDRTDTSGLLARRAAVLGLALCGSEEALPILMNAWNLSYHVNREVILALSLRRAYSVTDTLLKLVRESDNPWERAYAARCLGELFVSPRPQRLSTLIGGENYMLKDTRMMPFRTLANEFLYLHLLPAFGDTWR